MGDAEQNITSSVGTATITTNLVWGFATLEDAAKWDGLDKLYDQLCKNPKIPDAVRKAVWKEMRKLEEGIKTSITFT